MSEKYSEAAIRVYRRATCWLPVEPDRRVTVPTSALLAEIDRELERNRAQAWAECARLFCPYEWDGNCDNNRRCTNECKEGTCPER